MTFLSALPGLDVLVAQVRVVVSFCWRRSSMNVDVAHMFAAVVVGGVGLGLFLYGKKQKRPVAIEYTNQRKTANH